MKKQIWIMNHYAGNTYFDHSGRHYSFAKYLKRAGYEPVVFCCNAKHGKPELYFEDRALWHEHLAEEIHVSFVFVAARTYTGNGRQRILNMIDFHRNVKKTAIQYAKSHARPDVIYASSVHPLTLLAGIQLAKHFHIKCVCEVRDLWPESIVAYSKRLTKRSPFVQLLYKGEKWLYKKADKLIFTMEGGWDYICERGWNREIPYSKVYYINNGVDLESFDYNQTHCQIKDPDLDDTNTFKVIYTGSIREANGLIELINCAAQLKAQSQIKILLYGQGEELEKLKEICKEKGLSNLVFKGGVTKDKIPYILSKSNLNLLNYDPQTAVVYRFGSSQNKLFDYLASGKPILSNVRIAHSILDQYCCGFSINASDIKKYADMILQIYSLDDQKYQELCRNARAAVRNYNFEALTQKLISVIEEVSSSNEASIKTQ